MKSLTKSVFLCGVAACFATGAAMLVMASRTLGRNGDVGILVGGAFYSAIFILGPFVASKSGWLEPGFSLWRSLFAAIPLMFLPIAFFIGYFGWGDIQEHWIRASLHWVHRDISS